MSNLYSIRKIVKIPSTEIIDSKMSLKLEMDELLEEGWIVGLASSYVIRSIDDIAKTGYEEERVQQLKREIFHLTQEGHNKANSKRYVSLKQELDEILFLKYLVCVKIDKSKHYDLINRGFVINGTRYKRFLSTPASIKKGEVFYADETILDELQRRIDNGRNDKEFVPA